MGRILYSVEYKIAIQLLNSFIDTDVTQRVQGQSSISQSIILTWTSDSKQDS